MPSVAAAPATRQLPATTLTLASRFTAELLNTKFDQLIRSGPATVCSEK
jgi:hypothetical protein